VVVENPLPPFVEWLPGALGSWVIVTAALATVLTLGMLIFGTARRGPTLAARRFVDLAAAMFRDWIDTSPRRIWGLASLAIRESVRNRIVVALAVFAGLLMFAGWFFTGHDNPAKVYIDSIFLWTAALVTLVALLVAVFSLPSDIQRRTIYTIVTKPVRPHEIVIGRILGFGIVAAGMLGLMLAMGYFFIDRMLDHRHEIDPQGFAALDLPPAGGKFDEHTLVETGRLADSNNHHHRYSLNAGGIGVAETTSGHWHLITREIDPRIEHARADAGDPTRVVVQFSEPMDLLAAATAANYQASDGAAVVGATLSNDNRAATLQLSAPARVGSTQITVSDAIASRLGRKLTGSLSTTVVDVAGPHDFSQYTVGGPEDLLRARVPHYGKLRFTGREGEPANRGISVGSEWGYRSYVDGATQASAIWKFDQITPARFGDDLRVDLTVRVFRTHKGRIDQTTRGTIVLRNPRDPRIATRPRDFNSSDGPIAPLVFPRKLQGVRGDLRAVDLDLYDDLAADGELEIVVQCTESGQLFGVAQADAYLLAREASYTWNYAKAALTLFMPILIIIALAVAASTLVSSPVALLVTGSMLVCGLFSSFVGELAANQVYGGGPFEAAYRMQNRMNVMRKLEPGLQTTLINMGDETVRTVLWGLSKVLPDLTAFWRVDYVAQGFNIPEGHVPMLALVTCGFLIPLTLAGHLFLKTREVAA
jgi:hypothetical protein